MPFVVGVSANFRTAFQYIKGWLAEGLSANETLERLKEQGLGYRRQNFLQDVKTYRESLADWEGMKYTTQDNAFGQDRFIEADRYQARRYGVVYKYDTLDPYSGEMLTKHMTVYSDERLSRGEWEEEVSEVARENYEHDDIWGLQPVEAYESPEYRR